MDFTFTVTCSAEYQEGKFASREDLAEKIREAIEQADPGDVEGDNGGQYEIQNWEVTEEAPAKPARRVKVKTPPHPPYGHTDDGPPELKKLMALPGEESR